MAYLMGSASEQCDIAKRLSIKVERCLYVTNNLSCYM